MPDDPTPLRHAWLRLALAELPRRVGRPLLLGLEPDPLRLVEDASRRLAGALGRARAREVGRALERVRPARIEREAEAAGQQVVTPADAGWPAGALEPLDERPCALFLRGALPTAGAPCAALVGTRDATPYGLRAAREIALGLAEAGVWVVSGLAVGIDGAAHEGALEGAGPTLGVLGCGIDFPYPLAHEDLKEELAVHGGVLSEHPPGTAPKKWHFPRRNRLVAALGAVTVVIEAPARSGALITARLAVDLGRDVMAVPGSVFGGGHAGCHRLLRQGAALCEGHEDVLELLGCSGGPAGAARPPPRGEPAASLWRLLDDVEAVDASGLCARTGLPAAEVAAALTELELDGRVTRLPGVGFLRRS